MGGALQAIESGYIQSEIQESAYIYQREVEKKSQIVVGMNAYQVEENLELERLQVDPRIEAEQRSRLSELRSNRDQAKVSDLLTRLEIAARGDDNLMPLFIECVENHITLGEVCGVLREVWGEYQPPAWG
jgi:methylmalonyl-CoA mutase N-terminal domain/subunit